MDSLAPAESLTERETQNALAGAPAWFRTLTPEPDARSAILVWRGATSRFTRGFDGLGCPLSRTACARLLREGIARSSHFAAVVREQPRLSQGAPCFALALFENGSIGPRSVYARTSQGDDEERGFLDDLTIIAERLGWAALKRVIAELAPPSELQEPIRFSLLERTIATRGSRAVLSTREFQVLAAIALASRGITTDALADAIWPDMDGVHARLTLKVCVHRIRARIGRRDILVFAGGLWRTGPMVSTDLSEIVALTEGADGTRLTPVLRKRLIDVAVSLTCEVPNDVAGSSLGRQLECATNELRQRIGLRLVDDALVAGRAACALDLAFDLLRFDPYAEPLHERVVQAHLQLGNEVAAQRHLHSFARLLDEDLGVPLPARLHSLVERPAVGQ